MSVVARIQRAAGGTFEVLPVGTLSAAVNEIQAGLSRNANGNKQEVRLVRQSDTEHFYTAPDGRNASIEIK